MITMGVGFVGALLHCFRNSTSCRKQNNADQANGADVGYQSVGGALDKVLINNE